jgi:hypothetical protein
MSNKQPIEGFCRTHSNCGSGAGDRPQPVAPVARTNASRYIPKADGQQRPLAVAALEDKIVQGAACAVLNAIYEEDLLGFSYGFRAKRNGFVKQASGPS